MTEDAQFASPAATENHLGETPETPSTATLFATSSTNPTEPKIKTVAEKIEEYFLTEAPRKAFEGLSNTQLNFINVGISTLKGEILELLKD